MMRACWLALAIVISLSLSTAQPVRACNPHFPSSIIASDEPMLGAPMGDFHREVQRIRLPATPFRALPAPDKFPEDSAIQQTARLDLQDLEAALAELDNDRDHRAAVCRAYQAMRQRITDFGIALRTWEQLKSLPEHKSKPRPTLPALQVPEGLPAEFAEYARGALAWHEGRIEDARDAWAKVLQLPGKQRRFRSTWAAFMIGKSFIEADPSKALPWFEHVRELVSLRFADSLGLAAASYGWEARAHLNQKNYDKAIELYLTQHATGDPTAIVSIERVVERTMGENAQTLRKLAQHYPSRSVITAWIVANSAFTSAGPDTGPKLVDNWLKALDLADAKTIDNADRIAWAAYQAGRYDTAQKWVARAGGDSAMAQWISAKLFLRKGQRDGAAALLAKVSRAFAVDEIWQVEDSDEHVFSPRDRASAELGALQLSRSQYVESLHTLLSAGYWMDAAYVAERVLNIEELIGYVNAGCATAAAPTTLPATMPADQRRLAERQIASQRNLRWLLARRLTRLGRWREARPYFPAEIQPRLDAYIAAIRDGHDSRKPAADRATYLWEAARIARSEGLSLLATEVEPDWHAVDCQFDLGSDSARRTATGTTALKAAPASLDEKTRVARHGVEPEKRWHYWYTAADHAWAAAKLMPDESEQTAQILCEAGGWLKAKDPKAADRFYKSLITRCASTRLGKEAQKLRWLPKVAGA